jgi:hypothetical protein
MLSAIFRLLPVAAMQTSGNQNDLFGVCSSCKCSLEGRFPEFSFAWLWVPDSQHGTVVCTYHKLQLMMVFFHNPYCTYHKDFDHVRNHASFHFPKQSGLNLLENSHDREYGVFASNGKLRSVSNVSFCLCHINSIVGIDFMYMQNSTSETIKFNVSNYGWPAVPRKLKLAISFKLMWFRTSHLPCVEFNSVGRGLDDLV